MTPGDWNIILMALNLTIVMLNILYTTLLRNVYAFNLQHPTYKHVFSTRVESSSDPDQMASSETS